MRTTPELSVPEPYDEIAMKSIEHGIVIARSRSETKITAPLSTATSSGSRPCVVARDLLAELPHALAQVVLGDQDALEHAVGIGRGAGQHAVTVSTSPVGRRRAAATAMPGSATGSPCTATTG